MRITLISDSFPPEVRSASHLMYELGKDLVAAGHEVAVLTCSPQYNLAVGTHHRRQSAWVDVRREDGMTVARVRTLPIHNVGPLVRGVAQLTLPLLFLNAARRLPRPDCCVIYSPPLPLALVGLGLKRWRGAPYVLNVQDLFPQNAIDLGVLRNPALIALFRLIETAAYRGAALLAVHSPGNRAALLARGDLKPEDVVVAHNWVDCDVPTRDDAGEAARAAEGWGDQFVALFAGVMGYAQDLDTILDAAATLRDEPRVRFLLVGDGVVRRHVEQRVRDEALTNVELRAFVSRETYPRLIACVDAGLVTLRASMKTPVVPSKLLGYMAAACPVVATLNAESDGHGIIRDANCGEHLLAGDGPGMATALRQMASDPASARRLGRNGRAFAQAQFERHACTSAFEQLCRRVAASRLAQ